MLAERGWKNALKNTSHGAYNDDYNSGEDNDDEKHD